MTDISDIDQNNVPAHVAIIMDGNGRWAREKGHERVFGHLHGVEAVRAALKAATELGVRYLTLYAFSTENWNRPKQEVEALMDLLVQTIVREVQDLDKNNVRLRAIGAIDDLPDSCRDELKAAITSTAKNTGINLILALSYSARWEIIEAVKSIVSSGIDPKEVTEKLISEHLSTKDIPDPELVIRTSGEQRVSNFLLWQIAYAELYFMKKYWPDFREVDFQEAIKEFQKRQRRFGKTAEQ
ncbi:MAG: isoprenyl transferase [Cryomorphaceae bacterium]|nr:isoprenyl transferase [Cryomorphaceae bacterium]